MTDDSWLDEEHAQYLAANGMSEAEYQAGKQRILERIAARLPERVIARWKAEDWDDETMTASRYSYEDADTGRTIQLTEDELNRYAWGDADGDSTGGCQAGKLDPSWHPTHIIAPTGKEPFLVMLVDEAIAYTLAEWRSETAADYEVQDNGDWTFQGQPFDGTVERL